MICPSCNAEVPFANAKFCNRCGKPMAAPPPSVPPVDEQASSAQQMAGPALSPPPAAPQMGGHAVSPPPAAPPSPPQFPGAPSMGSPQFPPAAAPPVVMAPVPAASWMGSPAATPAMAPFSAPSPAGIAPTPAIPGAGPPPATAGSAPLSGPTADVVRGLSYSYRIDDRPSYSTVTVFLQPNQGVRAESGAMVAMSANVDLQSQMQGGVMGALKRAVTQESLFISTFTAMNGPGEVLLAPGAPGDVTALELQNQQFFVQGSSYLAGDPNLTVDTKWGGFKGFVSGAGLFLISISGSGTLFLSAYGAIHLKRLQPGERYVVDTGHIVAFESTIQYQLRKASAAGWFRSFASGEGVVADFVGPGDVYLQTRNLSSLADILRPFFPSGSGGGGSLFGGGS